MKNLILFLLLFEITGKIYGQDLINPYQNFDNTLLFQVPGSTLLNCKYQYPPQTNYNATNPNHFLYTPSQRDFMASSYLGEYQIVLNEFPWFKNLIFRPLAKTFKIEAASFPFTMPCWDQPSSCTYPSYGTLNQRPLYMPDDVYDGLSVKWGNLYNSHIGNFNLVEKWISEPATLVTRQFNVDPVQTPISVFYPHTILKHTIYLHCDVNYFSDIVDSISFYYDNTRGRMRFYPFFPNNIVATGVPAELWDVMFRPEVLVQVNDTASNYVCDFNQMSNSDWFDGGTIDYFQFSYSNSNCGSFNPQLSSVYVNNFTLNAITDEKRADEYDFVFPAPYSLISASLKNSHGQLPAGYEQNGLLMFDQAGVVHHYNIDQNIDLNIINPNEKTIYNPSEVDVTASDLHFPSYYTFKTIRGVYPTIANVTADDNDPQTGGPYTDPRDVPVRTDLRSENANDPQDPNTPWHSVYSSRYYLKTGCKLTIEPCVRIFDATFDVEEGATLLFEIQQYNLGFEHKNLNQTQNLGRYKIKGLGGAILRNYNATQYVQNGIITQPYKLHYKATSTILSGATVAAIVDDDDQLPGNYTIEPGGDVQFTAPDLISLRDGFSAKTGCTFKAKCEDPGILPDCPQQLNGNGGSKMMQNHFQPNANILFDGIVTPNPNDGLFTYRANNFSHENNCTVEIINSIGLKLISKEIVSENIFFDLSKYGKGVYFLKVMNGTKIKIEKVVVH